MYDSLIECKKILLYKEGKFVCESDKVIGVKKGIIEYLAEPQAHLKAKKTYKLNHHLIAPSFVNTHTHLPMSLFRGLADNLSLKVWLEDYIFPLEAKLVDKEFIEIGTKLALIELIRSGVSTCCDMYFYNEVIAQAMDEAGVRGYVGLGIPSVEKDWMEWKNKSLSLREKFKDHSRVKIALAPHAPYTLDSQTLKEIGTFAKEEEFFLTTHVSESLWEQEEIRQKHQKTPVQYLHDLGLTGKNSLFVHLVHANEKDLELMSQTGTSFSYNPSSNMKLGNGIAPVGLALQKKVTLGLGTDGSASNNNLNFFEEMGTGAKLQALKYQDESLTADQMFEIATLGGAKALKLEKEIGTLEVGKQADLIALDLNSVSFHPFYKALSQMVYTCLGQEVSFMMCAGKIIMEDYQIKTLDESQVLKASRDMEKKIQAFF